MTKVARTSEGVYVPVSGSGPLVFSTPQTIIDQQTARLLACGPNQISWDAVHRLHYSTPHGHCSRSASHFIVARRNR